MTQYNHYKPAYKQTNSLPEALRRGVSGDNEQNGSIFFSNLFSSYHENPNNIDYQNLKLDSLKGTQNYFLCGKQLK